MSDKITVEVAPALTHISAVIPAEHAKEILALFDLSNVSGQFESAMLTAKPDGSLNLFGTFNNKKT
jgi:hypothetical protein